MGRNTLEDLAFGQYGSAYTKTAGDTLVPPTGSVFGAVTCLEDTTFSRLVELGDRDFINTSTAAHDLAAGAEDDNSGSGGQVVLTTQTFPKGITIYGRWTQVDVLAGSVIAYIAK